MTKVKAGILPKAFMLAALAAFIATTSVLIVVLGRTTPASSAGGADDLTTRRSEQPAPADPAGRAATFAIRGVIHAGLLDPTSLFYDYQSTEVTGSSEWTATFQILRCYRTVEGEGCDPDVAEPPAAVDVAEVDGRLVVTDARGSMSAASRHRLERYSESAGVQQPRFTFPHVRVLPPLAGGNSETSVPIVQAISIWTGAPTGTSSVSDGTTCRIQIVQDKVVVYQGREWAMQLPATEAGRVGGIISEGIPQSMSQSRARVACSNHDVNNQYWAVLDEANLTSSAPGQVAVSARAVWEGNSVRGQSDACKASVYDSHGQLLGENIQRFPGPRSLGMSGGAPFEGTVEVVVEADVSTAAEASLQCGL